MMTTVMRNPVVVVDAGWCLFFHSLLLLSKFMTHSWHQRRTICTHEYTFIGTCMCFLVPHSMYFFLVSSSANENPTASFPLLAPFRAKLRGINCARPLPHMQRRGCTVISRYHSCCSCPKNFLERRRLREESSLTHSSHTTKQHPTPTTQPHPPSSKRQPPCSRVCDSRHAHLLHQFTVAHRQVAIRHVGST